MKKDLKCVLSHLSEHFEMNIQNSFTEGKRLLVDYGSIDGDSSVCLSVVVCLFTYFSEKTALC